MTTRKKNQIAIQWLKDKMKVSRSKLLSMGAIRIDEIMVDIDGHDVGGLVVSRSFLEDKGLLEDYIQFVKSLE